MLDRLRTHTEIESIEVMRVSTIRKSLLTSLNLQSEKKNCLIINPGVLTDELILNNYFTDNYAYKTWDSNYKIHDLKFQLKDEFDLVLLDHSGINKLREEELQVINNLRVLGRPVYSLISFYESITGRIPLLHVSSDWFFNDHLFFVGKRKKFLLLKRTTDILISLFILPIALPFASIGMLLTKLTSFGPSLFKQQRMGRNGKPFYIYKIRTMIYNPNGHNAHTVKNDNRITPLGNFLRKTKIDELPQLFNVLNGDMSLIGPRPEKVDIVRSLEIENPYYALRHTIKPGVSGWAQVNNPTATPNENLEKLEYDLFYVKNMSIFLDIKILIKTIKVIFTLNSL
jgi:lipopolysaccharide/colanic/teichoic acid biosynthesis glycosyltransferase